MIHVNATTESISALPDFSGFEPASEEDIAEAEHALNVKFAMDYRECLSAYGLIDANGHELTGVCNHPRLDVVRVTNDERGQDATVDKNLYVIERTGMDGAIAWQASDGRVVLRYPDGKSFEVAGSLLDYLSK